MSRGKIIAIVIAVVLLLLVLVIARSARMGNNPQSLDDVPRDTLGYHQPGDIYVEAHAPIGDGSDVGAFGQGVLAHDFLARGDQLVALVGDRQPVNLCGFEESLHVVGKAKNFRPVRGLIHANAFEYG